MIPDFQTLMRPLLAVLADGQVWQVRDIRERLAQEFGLDEVERAQMLASGRQRIFDNRVGWTTTYLMQAGLIERPRRAQYRITDEGSKALHTHPNRIDMNALEAYPQYLEFRDRKGQVGLADDSADAEMQLSAHAALEQPEPATTPTDLLEEAIATNRAAIEGDVLKAALALSPIAFEQLVIELLGAMGYGRSGALERTSASGDAGIDGIISQDPLGLDRIYVQAKRYAPEHSIDLPRIHEFVGALFAKQGDRGVYITTSRFTKGAVSAAGQVNARIELIDGNRLAQLMVQYGVGVETERTVNLLRLDDDYFENL